MRLDSLLYRDYLATCGQKTRSRERRMASPSEKPGETWTADRLARLAQLWTAGETAQAIADRLGVSRSAVMGKLFRLQLGRKKRRSKVGESRGRKPGESRGD